MVSLAGRQMARKISIPPRRSSAVIGYRDHRAKLPSKKVRFTRKPIRGINPPKAQSAPPYTYKAPRRTYRSNVTTAVTTRHTKPVTGKAKLKNQPPFVATLIYNSSTATAPKPQGTNITGFGLRNQKGSTIQT